MNVRMVAINMRRLLEEKNYFCQCGHAKRLHEGNDYSEWCENYRISTELTHCECRAFKLDNLRYLESLV